MMTVMIKKENVCERDDDRVGGQLTAKGRYIQLNRPFPSLYATR